MSDPSKSQKTPESQNPAQDVQGAFDTTVNFRVFAFVSLGMQEKLTSDSLNAYAAVFKKTGSAGVNKIDQKGLEGLTATFTKEKAQFESDHKTEQQKRDAARFSSKVKAAASTVSEGAKKAATTVSEGAKKAATTVSKGVNDTAQKLVGYVEEKKAKARGDAEKAAEAKAAAEAEAAAQSNAAAEAKAVAEAQAARDAKKAAEAKKATKETRVVWLNEDNKYGVTVDKKGAEQKPNINLNEGDFITFKGFTEADGSVISSALIGRFEGNAEPDNMWFIPWKSALHTWGGELFSKCSPNPLQRIIGPNQRTIDWFTVEKSEKPSRAPPPPPMLISSKDVTKKVTKPLLQQSVTTNPNDPLWAASDEEDETVAAATAAAAERNRQQQMAVALRQRPQASSSSLSQSSQSSQSSPSRASSSSSSQSSSAQSSQLSSQSSSAARLEAAKAHKDRLGSPVDLSGILGDDVANDDGRDITNTQIWYITDNLNAFKVSVVKGDGIVTLSFEVRDLVGPLTTLIKENRTAKEFTKTMSGASNGGLRIVITVPYSVYRNFIERLAGKPKKWTLDVHYKDGSEKNITLPGTWTAEEPSYASMSASAAAAANKSGRLFADDQGGGKRRRSIKKNRRSIRRTTIRRRQYKNKNKNNRRYKK